MRELAQPWPRECAVRTTLRVDDEKSPSASVLVLTTDNHRVHFRSVEATSHRRAFTRRARLSVSSGRAIAERIRAGLDDEPPPCAPQCVEATNHRRAHPAVC